MKLVVNKEIFSRYKPLKIVAMILDGINNNADINDFFNAEYTAIENDVKVKFEDVELSAHPVVGRWREIYKSFGEKEARSSIEALIKRVKNGKGLYKINPLVDLYNLASLKFELPAGGENIDAIGADLELTLAIGDEEFLPLGGGACENPNAGEIVYKFGKTVVCRNFNYRESDITKLTFDTKRAIIVFEDVLGDDENLNRTMEWLGDKAGRFLGARVAKTAILDESENEMVFS